MNRLTGIDALGYYMPCEMTLNCLKHRGECVDRLGAYEDTGLTPERCAELAKADKDGRLVVLPCKVGDTVYFVLKDSLQFYPDTNGWYIGESKVRTVTDKGFCDGEVGVDCITPWDDFGKTVFLSHEEAEQALKEVKDDG